MLKILHTIETRGPGGAEILLFNIAKKLNPERYENYGYFIKEGWIKDRFEEQNYKTFFKKPINSRWDIQLILNYLKVITRNQIKVIHSHEFALSFFSALLSLFINIKVISTFHGLNFHSENTFRQRLMRFISKRTKMVAVSEEVKRYICHESKVDVNKIKVIKNGIFLPDENSYKAVLKQELNLPEDAILIGSVGRLNEVKGYEYLIQAAKKVREQNDKIYFVIAGDGPERPKLENTISKLGLEKYFILLGNRNDVHDIFASLDVFILSSLSEGTSLALLEAMSHGLPVIATSVGGNVHVIKSENNGVLIPSKDTDAIYNAIINIFRIPGYKEKFGNINKEYVLNEYSFEKMINQYEELYHN